MNDFETMYPKIDEHLKTKGGMQALLREYFESLPSSILDNLETKLPKPYRPPVSPNSNPSSINA